MRFGKTLKSSVYQPWAEHYIDYQALKRLLREHDQGAQWTDQDEENFVQELINVQLDKVHAFQVETSKQLKERTAECEARLEPLTVVGDDAPIKDGKERTAIANETLNKLDEIAKEVSELEKYCRVNFAGFLKAAKKHDRKRGSLYRVRPLLQVRLSQAPFHSQDYSPVLYRLSAMYSFLRQMLEKESGKAPSRGPSVDAQLGKDAYTSYKFWVHSDNVVEVKTYILRRLPVLVYKPNTSKELDIAQRDPTIMSLYFDSPKFDLYHQKVARAPGAGSLRVRWTGKLSERPEMFLEKKTVGEGESREVRIRIKPKHIQSFIKGDYDMNKILKRMEKGTPADPERIEELKKDVEEIQSFIQDNQLQPMLRASYTRSAFQIPGDDKIRISLDTDLALIREDSLDVHNLCRNPDDWHRSDIDAHEMEYPYSQIPEDQISRFPHAILDIKVRGNGYRPRAEWLEDLMASHLVKEAPRFSKFAHGVAELFEDRVNSFPFWLSDLETDIRQDPESAFQQAQDRKAQQAEDEHAVGSFLGETHVGSGAAAKGIPSPASRFLGADTEYIQQRRPSRPQLAPIPGSTDQVPTLSGRLAASTPAERNNLPTTLRSLLPKFSTSRYARSRRNQNARLPPGIREPELWIKNAGPVRVEEKVWLANQRTFIKWQHICVLLFTLSLGLYNSAGKENPIARSLAIVYTGFAVFAAVWGYGMYFHRSRLIRERSGKDFDNVFGPFVICVGLAVALVLNFWFKVGENYLLSIVESPLTPLIVCFIELGAWSTRRQSAFQRHSSNAFPSRFDAGEFWPEPVQAGQSRLRSRLLLSVGRARHSRLYSILHTHFLPL